MLSKGGFSWVLGKQWYGKKVSRKIWRSCAACSGEITTMGQHSPGLCTLICVTKLGGRKGKEWLSWLSCCWIPTSRRKHYCVYVCEDVCASVCGSHGEAHSVWRLRHCLLVIVTLLPQFCKCHFPFSRRCFIHNNVVFMMDSERDQLCLSSGEPLWIRDFYCCFCFFFTPDFVLWPVLTNTWMMLGD